MPHGCGVYMIAIAHIPSGKSLVGAVKLVGDIGARIVDVDEEARRIVLNMSVDKLGLLKELCNRYQASCSLEVKASCRWAPEKCVLKNMRFRVVKSGSTIVYYGRFKDRIVEVEILGSRSKIKIGKKTGSRVISLPVPPGMFILSLDEAAEAARDLAEFIGSVVGSGGC